MKSVIVAHIILICTLAGMSLATRSSIVEAEETILEIVESGLCTFNEGFMCNIKSCT